LLGSERTLVRLEECRGWTREAVQELGLGLDGDRVTFPVRGADGELGGLLRHAPNGNRPDDGVKMLAEAGGSRELFPPVETVPDDSLVFLVEGEPDCVRARSLGLTAVAVPGVNGWRSDWSRQFAGRRICVVFDC